jgi:hypothetical protein
LDGARAGLLTGVHAVVYGEVAADHVGPCGGCVACEGFGCIVLAVCTVFAVVDADDTGVAVAGG